MQMMKIEHANTDEFQVFVAGDLNAQSTRVLLAAVRGRLIPGRVLGYAKGDGLLYRRNETVKGMQPQKDGTAVAFVCRNHACSLPVTTSEKLLAVLDQSTN
jgi:uncharacterized protein YyaL (SSP411 family)